LSAAFAQAWPPFVLVVGLVLIGQVAARDGLFHRLAVGLDRTPGGGRALLLAGLGLVAGVSAVLNLDTAAVFATPVLVLAARRRGLDERPFLYGALLMANAASLFLPGSNLTNLLVLAHDPIGGGRFAVRLLPAALAAVVVTAAGVLVWHRRTLAADAARGSLPTGDGGLLALRRGPVGVLAPATAAVLLVVSAHPALPVLGVAVVASAFLVRAGRLRPGEALLAVGPGVLALLFALAVGLGALSRAWGAPGRLMHAAAAGPTAALAAVAAVLVNNLPAAVLLSSGPVVHPRALLIGLNLGPNLAVTGSLSSYLWWRSARSVGAAPSARALSRQGVVLGPLAIAAALGATALLDPGRL